jgi:hypothetical protein
VKERPNEPGMFMHVSEGWQRFKLFFAPLSIVKMYTNMNEAA